MGGTTPCQLELQTLLTGLEHAVVAFSSARTDLNPNKCAFNGSGWSIPAMVQLRLRAPKRWGAGWVLARLHAPPTLHWQTCARALCTLTVQEGTQLEFLQIEIIEHPAFKAAVQHAVPAMPSL